MIAKASNKLEKRLSSPDVFINRELSWLNFARRVLELAADRSTPLLERVKFIGILGMLHDEFFMKRVSGLKRQISEGVRKLSLDGLTPAEELAACRAEITRQNEELAKLMDEEIGPALAAQEIPIVDYPELSEDEQGRVDRYFVDNILSILTPLAVDAEHPFPFISNLGLNLAIQVGKGAKKRFVRIKVPSNRPRWVPVRDGAGFVPLEQVIANNLDQLFPKVKAIKAHYFRVTRAAKGAQARDRGLDEVNGNGVPGGIIAQVTNELKARRFAGEVRLEVSSQMPKSMVKWLTEQLKLGETDIYSISTFLGIADLLKFEIDGRPELRDPPHRPLLHPRLVNLNGGPKGQIFDEIRSGDILLHHPYHSFDASVVTFLEQAAVDENVLAIKLTIYRTSSDSPIVLALSEAARRGKQVAVLVEITARFDEAPNIAWGRLLEKEGVHVAYGVEKLKTHVKAALVVREEKDGLRRYVHVGTGNYHTGTARIYEDFGLLSSDRHLSADVAAVFNELTSATPYEDYRKLVVAPHSMRERFTELIRREAEHARAGRKSGIRAKMNQLQDPQIIRELYQASAAGVPISLNVRGLCCLKPGIDGVSDTIRVFSVLGRFLEHSRVYYFENDGDPEVFLGSADWMKRNLDRRVETIAPLSDSKLVSEMAEILSTYENDNAAAWDLQTDGSYVRRCPGEGDDPRPAQECFKVHARNELEAEAERLGTLSSVEE